jgi:hypothetical protein
MIKTNPKEKFLFHKGRSNDGRSDPMFVFFYFFIFLDPQMQEAQMFDPQIAYLQQQQQFAFQQQGYQYPPQFLGAPPFPYAPFGPQFAQPYAAFQHLPRSVSTGSRVLWIGNLHQDTDERELHEVFSRFGSIEGVKV